MDKAQEKQSKKDRAAHEQGKHPEAARAWFTTRMTPAEIQALQAEAREREHEAQQRAEALAKFGRRRDGRQDSQGQAGSGHLGLPGQPGEG